MLARTVQAVLVAVMVLTSSACQATAVSGAAGASRASRASGVSRVVFDDFNGAAGARPDPRLWGYDLGATWRGDRDNPLSQTYTDAPGNVRLDGQGHLVIQAVRTAAGFTSARLVTRGKVDMKYGTVSARIKMPSTPGIQPAFWLLGATEDWPRCGEIDVIEMPHRATHWAATITGITTRGHVWSRDDKGESADLSRDFHTYWVTRRKDSITIGLDDRILGSWTRDSLAPDQVWVFNVPMYAILNIAVTANRLPSVPGPVQATMLVDWVRYAPAS
ncbi:glycoside hydrolase family 16 protein [Terrabacter sp. BE26]|uniref:glycoside hydrolase family 16 protein n=1 Tax=Terrabacter sp. BE26 TaxID=2898152 RepID=UPI0035BE2D96